MIELVSTNKISEITSFSSDTEIPKTTEKYSYLPIELIHNCKEKEKLLNFFLKAKGILAYLEQLFLLVKIIKQKEILIHKEQSKDTILMEGTSITLFDNEKNHYIEMVHGKEVLSACKDLLRFNLTPAWISDWIMNKEKSIADLKNTDNLDKNEIDKFNLNYSFTNVKELDIYRHMCSELLPQFCKEFSNYFTTANYFSNTGSSFFVIEERLYSYFIGNYKGFIPKIDTYDYYRIKYNEEYYNEMVKDIKTLSEQITEAMLLINVIPAQQIQEDGATHPFITKFFETHDISNKVFDYLEESGMIIKNKDKSNGLYTIIKNFKTEIITLFCYACKCDNPTYDLYSDIFSNYTRNPKQKYKYSKIHNKEYVKEHTIPLFNEIGDNQ